MNSIQVIKLNLEGEETWRYTGNILDRGENYILLEARFNYPQVVEYRGLVLRSGDRFIEIFYNDRWYNIFEVHDQEDDHLKGWYCNVGMPAVITDDTVSYRDLALDLVVLPDGKQIILDEDEFNILPLNPSQRKKALCALNELKERFERGEYSTPLENN